MSLVSKKNSDFCRTTENREDGNYKILKRLLAKHIGDEDEILVWGCGDPEPGANLNSDGYTNTTSVDIIEAVIANATKSHRDQYPVLVYDVKDVTSNTAYPDEKFNVVIDKRTLDAVMLDDKAESLKRATSMFNEIQRVLKSGGRYICVSLLQSHVTKSLISFFSESGWTTRVCPCTEVERFADFDGRPMFVVVFTKTTPGAQPVLEWSQDGLTRENVDSMDELLDIVIDIRESVSVCLDFNKRIQLEELSNGFQFEVNCSQTKKPRYTINIVESSTERNPEKMTFSAFVIPHGREQDWIFNDAEGKDELRHQCNVDRLAIISMHRKQVYKSLKQVQRELMGLMLKIAPLGVVQRKETILFLSLEQLLGERKMVVECTSELSGSYVVEDVLDENNKTVRRLVFLNMPSGIQSQTRLLTENGETKIDYSYFENYYSLYMGLGVGIVANQSNNSRKILLIGLGGGVLTNMFINLYKNVHSVALEIDFDVYKTAKEYFGLLEDSRLEVKICDGLVFLRDAVKNGDRYDAVVFDVDDKDTALGSYAPPPAFLSHDILSFVKLLIGNDGMFVLNFSCHSSDIKKKVLSLLKTNFKQLTALYPPGTINRVLLARNNNEEIDYHLLKQTAIYMNQCARNCPLIACDIIDVSKLKESIEDIIL